jgi:hypothetical protein
MKRLSGLFSDKDSPKSDKISPTQKDSPKENKNAKNIKKEDVKGFFTIYGRNINQISYKALLHRMDKVRSVLADNSSWAAMDGLREMIEESKSEEIEKLIKAKDPILLKTFIDKHLNQNRLIILCQQRRILKGTRQKGGEQRLVILRM